MKRRVSEPARRLVSVLISVALGLSSTCYQFQLPSWARKQAEDTQQTQAPPSPQVLKLRDAIQLKAMEEAADKVAMAASDLYNEAQKGSPGAEPISHPGKEASKLLTGGATPWSAMESKPSRQWLGVFTTELGNWFPLFQEEMNAVAIPSDKQAATADAWSQIQSTLQDALAEYQRVQSLVKTDPPDASAVGTVARNIYEDMTTIKSLANTIYQTVANDGATAGGDSGGWGAPLQDAGSTGPAKGAATASQSASSSAAQNAASTSATPTSGQASATDGPSAASTTSPLAGHILKTTVGLKDIDETSDKMKHASIDMMGELERWNLLWGQPPADQKGDMLWGGGLSKEEVMSEFRTMPTTVFTMPGYVKFFSYRLPPRKKWLLTYTRQLGELVNLMTREVAETALPEEKMTELKTPWSELQALATDVAARYVTILNLVDNTTDDRLKKSVRADQLTFGQPIVDIYNDLGKMHDLVKQIDGSIKGSD